MSRDPAVPPPNPLARHYTRFRVAERILLTGHSHQAWPDVSFEGQCEAWTDAAEQVDEKWSRAGEKADRVRGGFASLLGAKPDEIALGPNTHELLIRFLSALPLEKRNRLVTTDGEFHSIRRQMDRLAEDGRFEIVKVASDPPESIAERLAAAVNARTAAVLASSVLFGNAAIVPGLGAVASASRRQGTELVVDAYHHLNALPFSLEGEGLQDAFVVGGGYKYCQLGEGNCFLRVPPHARAYRPIVTGWYGEFARLTERTAGKVPYAEGAERWAGATYDPTSHYRAARVFDFFAQEGLAPEKLRAISLRQRERLTAAFDALDLDPRVIARDRSRTIDRSGAFVAFRCPDAGKIVAALRARGVATDARGELLRLGPAPYVADAQLDEAVRTLGEVIRGR